MRKGGGYYPRVLLFIALTTSAPLLTLPFYPEDAKYAASFIVPAVFAAVLGLVFSLVSRRRPSADAPRVWQSPLKNGSLPVLFAWCSAIVAGAVPFALGGRLGFVHALFESVSGWSTTGLSVVDVADTPRIYLFHRAFMQYCGGLGFIIVIAIVLQGRQMMSMYSAEGHPDGLMPNLKRMSVSIFLIYTSCLALGTSLYALFGMSVFEALCHAMSALSTAGFSTRAGSIGEYGSLPIELVTIVLMLIGSSNFAWLLLLVRRKFKRFARISEVRFMFATLAVFVPLVTATLLAQYRKGFLEALRGAVFCVVTMFSTTGYSTDNYSAWPPVAIGLLLVLMVLGAGTGSTAGGIKMLRAYILARITKANISRRLSPSHSVKLMRCVRAQGEMQIDDGLIRDTIEFTAVYGAVLFVGTFLGAFFEGNSATLGEVFFEFTSALGTVGVSNGLTARAANGTLIVEMLGMLMGRLEIFIVLLGLYSVFEKLKKRAARLRAASRP
ncbi:MAG: TrkH family potassium uptake protein [Oscillospiraceae bacterium]|jgi:trk system potassium uptake protein TrkH|nr:TrkH family potassium uptake protein [Oscillospiraceae bacterium]